MRISVRHPTTAARVQLDVIDGARPWRITTPGEPEEALLDPDGPAFLAGHYPAWLGALCEAADADRQLALAIVSEVRRRIG